MCRNSLLLALLCLTLLGCATDKQHIRAIASLKDYPINLTEPKGRLPISEARAREYYREFLSTTSDYQMYSQALRRLADLQLKVGETKLSGDNKKAIDQGQRDTQASIRLYTAYLETHPNYPNNDQILYQLAKAYELDGQPDKSLEILDRIMHFYPDTQYRDEVEFRRGEMLFLLKRYNAAAQAYHAIITNNPQSIFYEKAMYKYGWTQFKMGNYKSALGPFFAVMDRKQEQGMLQMNRPVDNLLGTQRELIVDTLRAISLCFAYDQSHYTLSDWFKQHGDRPYEPLVYLSLGKLFFKQERVKDAADTYMAFVHRYPTSPLAPEFHTEAINAYEKGGLTSLVLPAKEEFVKLYGVGSAYWKLQTPQSRERIKPLLARHITEIATYYHAVARKSKKPQDFYKAATWYERYITTFPDAPNTGQINFLKAEALFDGRYYVQAAQEYEKTAYHYPPFGKSATAGYSALLSYAAIEKLQPGRYTGLQQKAISSMLRFADHFPSDAHVPAVLTRAANELFKTNDYLRAASVAQKLVRMPSATPQMQRTAWIILGHSQFAMKNYAQAEHAYRESLRRISTKDKEYQGIYDRLAASIYKQGEQARDAGNLNLAVSNFLRVGQVTPASGLRANADYDAATTLIKMKQYRRASGLLEVFRKRYPKNALNAGIPEKLALIYSETGQSGRAAHEMEILAANHRQNKTYRADLLWKAGTYYAKARMTGDAKRVYAQYIREFPQPLERAEEARNKLAEYARHAGDSRTWGRWLRAIIQADASGGAQRSDRTRYLAADATLKLAQGQEVAYKQAHLTQPLKHSLRRKKDQFQATIKAYENAIQYRIANVTTAATYQLGELYSDFARSLTHSPPPRGLSGDALAQYKVLLDDQAFPFEEKSIDIHAANVKQISDGIYDKWVKASLAKLRKVDPARYAKYEKVQPYVENIY
ncbi:MAG: tetratricopeptide repeat protein [Gammaproteobacteria bacterium]